MQITELIDTPMIKAGNEYHTACPMCGGKDRFIIFENNRFWCRQCNEKGDTISLLMKRDNLTYKEACERAGATPRPTTRHATTPTRPPLTASTPRQHEAVDFKAWQQSALNLWHRAWEYMLDNRDNEAEAWLKSRGLTLNGGLFGYIPTSYKTTWGGVEMYIPEGLLIAWSDKPMQPPYKLNVRRLAPTPEQTKYHMIKESENGLYLSYLIKPSSIVCLVEGELDALTVYQQTNREIIAVATGSNTGGRLLKHIAQLATAKRVLIALDNDEAGEAGAEFWLKALPNATRLKPTAKDPNDMLKNGENIKQWIQGAL